MPTTPLLSSPLAYPSPTARFLVESWWTCASGPGTTWRVRSDALLTTGEPLSVVPPSIRDALDIEVYPERGWRGRIPSWFGVSCRIGRVTVWLPSLEQPGLYTDHSLLVLLPAQDVTDAPPYIRLGTQFLAQTAARVVIEAAAGGTSQLVIP